MSITQDTYKNIDIDQIRAQFPVLHQKVNGKPLVYFDNAATSQKPQTVIDAVSDYYQTTNANIHRGIHHLAEKATSAYENTREKIQQFINAPEKEEIIFTGGTTESINLVTNAWGRKYLSPGDEVIISAMEHHSNIVPWQMICEERGAVLKVIPVDDQGDLIMEEYEKLLSPRTKMVAVVYVSNTLGTINPVKKIIDKAHDAGALVLVDGAQAVPHIEADVQALDADFYAFSGHKMYGPTGVGVLYGKRQLLESMSPYKGGGEMIEEVTFEKTTYNELPYKFEAGTPNIADVVAMSAAVDFINNIGKENILAYENELLRYGTEQLLQVDGLKIIGRAEEKASVISFVFDDVHHQDIGIMLDTEGIAVRTGHHCTQPLMNRYGVLGTSRASFALYNTKAEIDCLVEGLNKVLKILR